ncbi:hypothetical protein LAZ67_2005884 [Cordylochernes scorpioides]|uniref:Tc1-like transposase DDE domain-containing protein n=1 Tax=Cordylochernes scorpioides TaxID=51811 RepID=A0ABY6K4U3_9ARAC|nr:hypothetical protein LAZ67_2005884 [Cordylochernes scorpioides]
MVCRWRSWFLEGRQNVHDDERSGRPVTVTDNAAVAAVRNVMEADRRVTIDGIMIRLPPGIEIGRFSIGTIMSDVLNFRKVCARWVPRLLSENHKQQRMEAARAFLEMHRRDGDQLFFRIVTGDESWVHHSTTETKRQSMVWKKPEESSPKKAKVTISAGKVMAIVFWDCKVLTKLRAAIKRKRLGLLSRKVLLVHDNARPHAARTTQTLLENLKWEIFTHPPYSPDLAPSDFHLFPVYHFPFIITLHNSSFHTSSLRQHLSQEKKRQAIGRMEAGQSQAEVARWLGGTRNVVSRLWKKFQTTANVARTPGQGRPRVTTLNQDRYLSLLMRRNRRMTASQLRSDLNAATGVLVSTDTISRRLHKKGLYARRPIICGSLQKPRFYGLGWNLLGRSHSTPYFSARNPLTGQRYRDEILAAYVMPQALEMGENFLLMDDNARPHRAGVVDTFLQNHAIARMNWPARSPDLNLIEHVWDNLGRRISSLQPPPRNTHELETALTQEWALIPQELINSLILSMGHRCRACLSVKGDHTPY